MLTERALWPAARVCGRLVSLASPYSERTSDRIIAPLQARPLFTNLRSTRCLPSSHSKCAGSKSALTPSESVRGRSSVMRFTLAGGQAQDHVAVTLAKD